MKQYPKIGYFDESLIGQYCYAFDKLDGSNIRFEFSKKRNWYKFGTRNEIIDSTSRQFGKSIDLFINKYGDGLAEIFKSNKQYRNSDSFVAFAEYFGENSFAGQHQDEKMDIKLFDISQYKRGLIPPKEFIENFGHLDIPDLVYQGYYNFDMIDSIRSNKLGLKEGVVIKGIHKTKGNDIVWMSKVKTNDWLIRVREKFGEKALLEELNGNKSLLV